MFYSKEQKFGVFFWQQRTRIRRTLVTVKDKNSVYFLAARKGKSIPLQAWNGPEGSRKLRFPDFMTTVQDGGKVVSLTHRPPLTPINAPGTNLC